MIGVALLVGFVLLYRAYVRSLEHSERLRLLERENARLRQEVMTWQSRYQELLASQERQASGGELSAEEKVARLAQKLSAKEPFL
ncbi:MAG: hypothetical protein KatS3mg026_0536 [Bacteroidia bacterium]|nr:MAG: hypothetical protein KatS3mg026_0536 [Bacteroidia bacterium]